MHPITKQIAGLLGRVGTRAVAEAVDSVLEDADRLASNAKKKVKKARKRIAEIPREAEEPGDE